MRWVIVAVMLVAAQQEQAQRHPCWYFHHGKYVDCSRPVPPSARR